MDLNILLREKSINPETVIVMRHRPAEPQLRKVLPWLAAEKPDLFNAYQQTHGERVETALTKAKHVASLIAHGGGQALFVGVYAVQGWKRITQDQFYRIPANQQLGTFGAIGISGERARESVLWFDLVLT